MATIKQILAEAKKRDEMTAIADAKLASSTPTVYHSPATPTATKVVGSELPNYNVSIAADRIGAGTSNKVDYLTQNAIQGLLEKGNLPKFQPTSFGNSITADRSGIGANPKMDFLQAKLPQTLIGSVQNTISDVAETGGYLLNSAKYGTPNRIETMQQGMQSAPTKQILSDYQKQKATSNKLVDTGVKNIRSFAEKTAESGQQNIEQAKLGLGGLGKLGVDLTVGGTQLAGDLAVGLATGTGLAPMGVRTFGSGASEARKAGATEGQQYLFGAAAAALEMGTEKLFNVSSVMQKAFGKGAIKTASLTDNAITKLVKREFIKTEAGQGIARNLINLGLAMSTEAAEEMISEVASPLLKRMIYDPNADSATMQSVLYAGLIGGLLGGIIQAGSITLSTGKTVSKTEDIQSLTPVEVKEFTSILEQKSIRKQCSQGQNNTTRRNDKCL